MSSRQKESQINVTLQVDLLNPTHQTVSALAAANDSLVPEGYSGSLLRKFTALQHYDSFVQGE